MKIKETKYSHRVKLVHPTGKVVVRYTNKPEDRAIVLMDNGYKPLEGQTELQFEEINPVKSEEITENATVDSLDPVVTETELA